MLIFLYGPDSYRRLEKQKELVYAHNQKHSGTRPYYLDLEEKDGEEKLREFVRQKTLIYNFDLGIVRNFFSSGLMLADLFKEQLDRKDLVLIIVEEEEPPANYKFILEKPIVSQFFEYLSGKRLVDFLLKEATGRGLSPSLQFINKLILTYGSNSWAHVTEFDRLAQMASLPSETEQITKSVGDDFFRILNGFKNPVLGRRLLSLEWLLYHGEEPAKIFNILSAQKSLKSKFANYDVMIKSGRLDYEEVLLDFVL